MQVGHGGAEESLLESYKSTNLPPLTAQQIWQRYCLTPTSVTLTGAEEPSSVCAGVRLCVRACVSVCFVDGC